MLELLHIENIAIIESADIRLSGQTFCSAAGSTRSPARPARANPS